jgi:hypothetical protein
MEIGVFFYEKKHAEKLSANMEDVTWSYFLTSIMIRARRMPYSFIAAFVNPPFST